MTHRSDTQCADAHVRASAECVALVREAVAVHRHRTAVRGLTADERQARPETWRVPELDYSDWYARAEAAVTALDERGQA